VEELFGRLNRSLNRTLTSRTFVCFVMGDLNLSSGFLRLCNGGCPYPYHFISSTGELVELQVDAYPLGIRSDTEYAVAETQLQAGDYLIFCSDGIVEADRASGEQFGFDRTADTIRQACKGGLSAEATIDRLLGVVRAFKEGAPQSDDMTCVVMRVSG
jgi:sigma-B regulation protein RsbU (phosphoserine phosphatase)